MSDTTLVANAGSGGGAFAGDLNGSNVFYPYSKVMWGGSGIYNHVDATTPMPVAGAGTAGSPAGGVLSIQGVASGVAIAISAASLPLPTGAATAAKQPALGTAGTASTDVITVQGIAGAVAIPVSAASLPLPTGAATAAKQPALGTAGTASADVISIQGLAGMTPVQVSQSGTWTVGLSAGSNTIGGVTIVPSASGGLSPHSTLSAASTNATVVKASAGRLYKIAVTNTSASIRYVKIYDKATNPNPASDTPVMRLVIPGNTSGAGFVQDLAPGVQFANGISYLITGAVGDTDATAIGANEVVVNLAYA